MSVREREHGELPSPICPCPTERLGRDLLFLEPGNIQHRTFNAQYRIQNSRVERNCAASFLSLWEHGRKIHCAVQQADEENTFCPNLIKNRITFKPGHAKTSDAGLLQIFPAASDFRMPDNPFKCFGGAVFKTNGKFRGNLAGETRDDFREVAFKNGTERGFHLAAARALATRISPRPRLV